MHVKQAPATALRAIFGGIGALLSVTDKLRETLAAPPPTTVPPATTVPPMTTVPPTARPEEGADLPVAHYDALSLASLRARLRNLSADQLITLIAYEKSHAGRADVISMFERRIVKLSAA